MHKEIPTTPTPCLRSWQLDQYELGLLAARELLAAKSHLRSCVQCAERLEQRRRDSEEMATMPGFDALIAKFGHANGALPPIVQRVTGPEAAARQRAPEQTPTPLQTAASVQEDARQPKADAGWVWWRVWSLSGMSAAVLAVMIMAFQPPPSVLSLGDFPAEPGSMQPARRHAPVARKEPPTLPQWLGKSTRPVFGVVHFHKGTKYSQWTKSREELQPGDLIQFAYQLPRATHAMIASINEQGQISVFFPLGGRRSAQLAPGAGTLPHDGSLELDDYLGKERISIVTSMKPIAFADLKAALQKAFLGAGRDLAKMAAAPGPWHYQSILIQKTRKRAASSVHKLLRKRGLPQRRAAP